MRNILRAIGIGTIAVALLDATDGVVFFGLTLHFNPVQVLQYIASGAFGRSAFDGGLATAFAGPLVIHFGLAAAFTAIFAGAYLRFRRSAGSRWRAAWCVASSFGSS